MFDPKIGKAGVPWGDEEKAQWLALQTKQRSYATDVLSVIERMRSSFDVIQYGELRYAAGTYPLFAFRSRDWKDSLPSVLVTGGVHGYETSGVHGALQFVEHHAASYAGKVNLLVVPCVSPWGYEHVQRWNPNAVDPNRSFSETGLAEESRSVMRLVAPWKDRFVAHVDLHETTDTDATEFRLALAARDGKIAVDEVIPDGFYLVGDSDNPQLEFQKALIAAVEKVTHIAPPDERNEIIGAPVVSPGVILYPVGKIGLCAGVTTARFTTTTEVYPDSAQATPEQCNAAQVACVRAAIDFALKAAPAKAA